MNNSPIAFDVILKGKVIDTVFYAASDKIEASEVKQSLIDHDGYNSEIVVVRSKK